MDFKQSIDLGLDEPQLIEEIGDLYNSHGELDQALIAYRIVSTIAPEYPEGLRKYAEVLKDPKCLNQDIEKAIEYYKRCLRLIDGDVNKTAIARSMETLLRKIGRDYEIREIQQYLDQDRPSDYMSDEDVDDDDNSFT